MRNEIALDPLIHASRFFSFSMPSVSATTNILRRCCVRPSHGCFIIIITIASSITGPSPSLQPCRTILPSCVSPILKWLVSAKASSSTWARYGVMLPRPFSSGASSFLCISTTASCDSLNDSIDRRAIPAPFPDTVAEFAHGISCSFSAAIQIPRNEQNHATHSFSPTQWFSSGLPTKYGIIAYKSINSLLSELYTNANGSSAHDPCT
mmetsp:Transcript_26323/g.65853  ORF Transcript_26323/g.65853 Transcript_26323/m.65853 type:complete len:208 (-) Transcript_26323:34-657(-)